MADVPHVRLSDGAGIAASRVPREDAPSRGRESFDLALPGDDLAAIAGLDVGHRTGPDPITFGA